jgi:hypothetical protein
VPFPADNHLEVIEKKNHGYFRPASGLRPDIPHSLDLILSKMLARQPRDRYQTASELIIDLERSRLAVLVPSFADPELARNDPLLQSWLSTAEPTRLDPDSSSVSRRRAQKEQARAEAAPVDWVVRYRNRAGRGFTTRLSTEDLIARLEEGTLPANAVARRPDEEKFQPLSAFAELADHLPDPEPEPEAAPDTSPEKPSGGMFLGLFLAMLGGAAVVAVGALALGRWVLLR